MRKGGCLVVARVESSGPQGVSNRIGIVPLGLEGSGPVGIQNCGELGRSKATEIQGFAIELYGSVVPLLLLCPAEMIQCHLLA